MLLLKKILSDNYKLEILLAITYISNLVFTFLLNKLSLFKILIRLFSYLNDFRILRFIIYIFIYKKNKKSSCLNRNHELIVDY